MAAVPRFCAMVDSVLGIAGSTLQFRALVFAHFDGYTLRSESVVPYRCDLMSGLRGGGILIVSIHGVSQAVCCGAGHGGVRVLTFIGRAIHGDPGMGGSGDSDGLCDAWGVRCVTAMVECTNDAEHPYRSTPAFLRQPRNSRQPASVTTRRAFSR